MKIQDLRKHVDILQSMAGEGWETTNELIEAIFEDAPAHGTAKADVILNISVKYLRKIFNDIGVAVDELDDLLLAYQKQKKEVS